LRRQEKADRIVLVLDEAIPEVPIPLSHVDPFTLLVAVLLSAQTTDKKVNEVTPRLFERGGSPSAMAQMDVEEIRQLISVIGLAPTKARNLKRLSELLIERHGSEVPESFEELEDLPGVGHKTASVVMSQAFGHAAFPVDTHIHRLAWRWGLSDGRSVEQTEADLKRLFSEDSWNRLHLQIIYFGRQYCPARGHDPESCPICSWGAVRSRLKQEAAGGPRKSPPRKARAKGRA
jgi:endonuclease-3